MILTKFLNFVTMAMTDLINKIKINKYNIYNFSEKIVPFIYIGNAYTPSGKIVEIAS